MLGLLRTCCYGAAGGVNVEVDRFLGVVGFKEEELRDDGGGHGLVDFAIETYDALLWRKGVSEGLTRRDCTWVVLRTLSSLEKMSSVACRGGRLVQYVFLGVAVLRRAGCRETYRCASHLPRSKSASSFQSHISTPKTAMTYHCFCHKWCRSPGPCGWTIKQRCAA